jgi:NAD(P)-dependent dehydrogenase (short-subunit alcohol dehydrogenase family)
MAGYEAPGKLNGKVALVTGAARGIGKAIALELARAGADVIVASRSIETRETMPGSLTETAEAIKAFGRRALPVKTDVSVPQEIDALVKTSLDSFGRVDILVNNAAYMGRAWYHDIWNLSRENWNLQFTINVTAPFHLTQALAPRMKEQGGGLVLNISSGAGNLPVQSPQRASSPASASGGTSSSLAYGVTKAALNRFTAAIAQQLLPANIAAIALDPGGTRTEMYELAMAGGRMAVSASNAHPVEVPAKAALYLLTCDDPFLYTGQVIVAAELVRRHRLLG